MKRLSEFDFSELEYYVDCLLASRDVAERERYAEIIADVCETLPAPTMAAALVAECARFAAWGISNGGARDELARLAVAYAGSSAAQVIEGEIKEQQRATGRMHGLRGGRPRSESGADWLKMFNDIKGKNSTLSDTAVFQRIACRWADADREGRDWKTIRDAVRREQEKNAGRQERLQKPPLSK